jgi:hypothetical protein
VARSPDIHCFSPCSQRTHFILLSSIPSSYCRDPAYPYK